MTCPVEIASEMAAFRAVVGDHARHQLLYTTGHGVSYESKGVMCHTTAKKISWWQTAKILGISDRPMRRWRERYEAFGFRGLFDRRRGRPSPKRVPEESMEPMLGLYRERYCTALLREAGGQAPDSVQLQLAERYSARIRVGGQGAQARSAPQTTRRTHA